MIMKATRMLTIRLEEDKQWRIRQYLSIHIGNILSILCFEKIMSISIENIISIFLTISYQYLLEIFWQYFVNFFWEYSGNIFWQYYVNFYWEYFIKSNIPGVRPLSKQNQWRDSTQQSRERYHTLCLLDYVNEISLKQEYWKKKVSEYKKK